MTNITRVVLAADSTQIRAAKGDVDNLQRSGEGANKTFGLLKAAFVAAGGAMAVRQVVDYTNRWTDLNSRLVNATGSQDSASAAMTRLSATARNTYSSIEQTSQAFLNNAMTLNELGYSMDKQIDLTDSLNNALVVSGTKGQQAESVMMALSKSFALGELRGENFNTVIQSGGRIVQALADGLGVGTLELRAMAEAGELQTGRVVEALTSQMEKLRKEAGDMPATIGDGFVLLGNAMFETVGRMDQALGASAAVSSVLVGLADNMDGVVDVVAALSIGLGSLAAIHMVRFVAQMGLATAAQGAFNAVAILNPYVVLAAGVAALSYALITYTKEQDNATSALGRFLQKGMSNEDMIEAIGLMVDENGKLVDSTEAAAAAAQKYHDKMRPNIAVTADMFIGVGGLAGVLRNATKAMDGYGDSVEFTHDAHDAHIDTLRDYTKRLEDAERQVQNNIRKDKDYLSGLNNQLEALKLTGQELALFNAGLALSADVTPEVAAEVDRLTIEIYELTAAQKAATDEARELERASDQAAKHAQEQWQKTHDYLSGAFVDIMNNGGNAFDNIAKAFERTVQRMVAEWAASGLMRIFGMGGGGTPSSIGSFFGGAGGGGSLASTAVNAGASAATSSIIGALTKGAAGSASFVGPVVPGAAATAGGAAGIGGTITSMIGAIPGWGWAAMGAVALAGILSKDSGPSRTNAGMLVGPTPGAKSQYTFGVDQFESGLNVTGIARREDRSEAEKIIQQFRDIDSIVAGSVRALGGTIDLSRATLAGLNENARAGSSGTFLGRGLEGGDIGSQLNSFVDQLADHISGLDASLILAVQSAGSAEEAISILTSAVDAIASKEALLDKYASQEQKIAAAREEINKTFAQFNREVPDSVEQLRDMISAIDPLTESGKEAIAALEGLSGAISIVQAASTATAASTVAVASTASAAVTTSVNWAHLNTMGDMITEQNRRSAGWYDGSHAGGLDYVPFDGYRAQLHRGEKVLTSGEASDYNSLAGQFADLKNAMVQMLGSIMISTRDSADILDRWEAIGQPEARA
jgi:tape measure domain-containing protein